MYSISIYHKFPQPYNLIFLTSMNGQFPLWYAYYDSIFSKHQPAFPMKLAFEAILINSPVKPNQKIPWPKIHCPQLAESYEVLQEFIETSSNWTISRCTSEELQTTQDNLNLLYHFLQLEKSYANQFWRSSKRRVQASATHFYCFLQYFARSLILYPTMTIFQCKAAQKLCIGLQKLQELMNTILSKVNKISEFLSTGEFQEEINLTYNFMENMVYFMKKMPTFKRNKIIHIPNLTKFVILNNPIQISKNLQQKSLNNRKKSNTTGSKMLLSNYSERSAPKKIIWGHLQLAKSRSYSYGSLLNQKTLNISDPFLNCPTLEKLPKLFKFPSKLNQYSISSRLKKNTLESLRTLTIKIDSIEKNKSSTLATMSSPMTNKRKTEGPHNIARSKKKNRPTKISIHKYYEQQQERLQLQSVSSAITNNITAHLKPANKQVIKTDRVMIRQEKQKTALKIMDYETESGNSRKVCLNTGETKRNGWDIVRKYVWSRIHQKRLKSECDFSLIQL